MHFMDVAKARFSVRKFQEKAVEREKLMVILEAARIAPSAVNFQPWHFIVVQDKNMRDTLCETYNRDWLKQAPVIIVACGDHKKAWHRADGKDHCDIDIAIAVDHMTLAAVEQGLGTCWICAFDAAKCAEIFKLPDHIEPIALLPVGYPSVETDLTRHTTKRSKIEEIVSWDTFKA